MSADLAIYPRFEPEEIAEIMAANGQGDVVALAKMLRREARALYDVRRHLHGGQKARAAHPAVFLPDDGLPYAVRMALILREANR